MNKINFESLYERVGVAGIELDADVKTGNDYARELIDLISAAKRDGISAYVLIEVSILRLHAENIRKLKALNEPIALSEPPGYLEAERKVYGDDDGGEEEEDDTDG